MFIKNNLKTKIAILVLTIFTFGFLFIQKAKAQDSGFGASPAAIENYNLLPGNSVTSTLYVSRSGGLDEEMSLDFLIEASGFGDWLKFNNDEKFTFASGVSTGKIPYTITVPSDAELGNYSGSVTIRLNKANSDNSQVAVIPGVKLDLNLGVTDKVTQGLEILLAKIPDLELGDDVSLTLKIENIGNAPDTIDQVEVEILDISQNPITNFRGIIADQIKGFSTEDRTLKFQNSDLALGTYYANVKVYYHGEEIFSDLLSFNVLEATLDTSADVNSENRTKLMLGIIFLTIDLVVITSVMIYRKRRKHIV